MTFKRILIALAAITALCVHMAAKIQDPDIERETDFAFPALVDQLIIGNTRIAIHSITNEEPALEKAADSDPLLPDYHLRGGGSWTKYTADYFAELADR